MNQAVMTETRETTHASVRTRHDPESSPSAAAPFSAAEVQQFHDQDHGVGKMIVGIMGGIFTIGVVLYSFIAYLAARGSH